jgi:hypothetical protein
MLKKIFILLLIVFLIIFIFLIFNLKKPKEIKASPGSGDNVWGWAWAENIGWISFNCDNPELSPPRCASSNYGVNIASSTGILSGYAWSRGTNADIGGIGWISFADFDGDGDVDANDKNIPGSPCAPNCEARVDLNTGQVSGWARALAGNPPAGGWDGWIKLRGTNYGVSLNTSTKEFEGWAWGGGGTASSSAVVGWISFNCKDRGICSTANQICDSDADCSGGQTCVFQQADGDTACTISNYKVLTSLVLPPSVFNLQSTFPDPCTQSRIPTLSWNTNASMPYDYELQIDNDPNFGSPNVTSSASNTNSTQWSPNCLHCCDVAPYNTINFGGGTYYWRVRARNISGPWSDWASSSFNTYSHCYPYPDFTPVPSNPAVDEIVTFYQDYTKGTPALCYSGGEDLCQNKPGIHYWWDFDYNLNPGTDSQFPGNATTTYSVATPTQILLTIQDDIGTCFKFRAITLTLPLPKWKEIKP